MKELEKIVYHSLQKKSFCNLLDNHRQIPDSINLILTFDIDTKEMYGFQYVDIFEDGKDAYELTKKLNNEFDKAYGEPTTYPELTNRIVSMPGYDDLWEKEPSGFSETWKKDDILESSSGLVTLKSKVTLLK